MLRSPDSGAPRAHPRRQIVLFSASRDWHARVLSAALKRHGADVTLMPLESCEFDTASRSGLRLGRLHGLPDGAIVRTVSSGSFEAVTRRLGILHALSALGVRVWNSAAAIERCVDKSMTTFLLARVGIPVPPTWTVEGIDAARTIAERECAAAPLVAKPLFGSQGRGLVLVRTPADLPRPEEVSSVYYLQRFVGGDGPEHRDFRVFVIEGRAVAAMGRRAANWITNVKQGGKPVAIPLDRELSRLASTAAKAVGASFCGVDILRAPDGTAYVLELNSMPAWSGLQSVSDIDIADALAASFCRHCRVDADKERALA